MTSEIEGRLETASLRYVTDRNVELTAEQMGKFSLVGDLLVDRGEEGATGAQRPRPPFSATAMPSTSSTAVGVLTRSKSSWATGTSTPPESTCASPART